MDYLGFEGAALDFVKRFEAALQERVLRRPEEARLQALLNWPIWHGSLEQLRLALAAGADPNYIYPSGETPLALVLRARREHQQAADFFRELVKAGADPALAVANKSLITIACAHGGNEWVIELLLEVTPPGKLPPEDLSLALRTVAASNHLPSVKRLLAAGAPVNALGGVNSCFFSDPGSALMFASALAHFDVMELLQTAGADVNLKDHEGHTACDYARLNLRLRQAAKSISLLERAGGVFGKPFFFPETITRGFATAAKTPAYKAALARLRELTGKKPATLQGEDGKIPGGYGVLFDQKSGEKLMAGKLSEFADQAHPVQKFVRQHQAEFLAQGFYLFFSRDLLAKNGDVVALLPTADVYKVIGALETNGANSIDDLITWLREMEKTQPFAITGIGSDFVEGTFTTPVNDPVATVKAINDICLNDSFTPAEIAAQTKRLSETNRLYLWWD